MTSSASCSKKDRLINDAYLPDTRMMRKKESKEAGRNKQNVQDPPSRNFRVSDYIIILLIILSFTISAFFYNSVPDRMASHWGVNGQANGFMGKNIALFLLPGILAVMYGLLKVIPKIDPRKENIKSFEKNYNFFVLVTITFLFYVHILTLIWNMGYYFNMTYAVMPGVSIIFFSVGILMEKTKMNYSIGIRTPWTLASETVWNKTHKLGGMVFKTIAILMFISMFLPKIFLVLSIIFMIGLLVWVVVYSYLEFRKEEKTKQKRK